MKKPTDAEIQAAITAVLAAVEGRPVVSNGSRKWYKFGALADGAEEAELSVYDVIGRWWEGVSAKQFVTDLAALPKSVKTIKLRVNSPGGDVFDAVAIANALKLHAAQVVTTIEGLAASAATIITQGGSDTIRIGDNAMVMVHLPASIEWGNAVEMRKMADLLDQVTEAILTTYERRSPLDRKKLRNMMDDETWMLAEEAVSNGFADEVFGGSEVAASVDPRILATMTKHPKSVTARVEEEAPPVPPVKDAVPPPAPFPFDRIAALCGEAGLDLPFALAIKDRNLGETEVKVAVAAEKAKRATEAGRVSQITALCDKFNQAAMAKPLIDGGTSVESARALVAHATALADGSVKVDTSLVPDGKPKGTLNVVQFYREQNQRSQ